MPLIEHVEIVSISDRDTRNGLRHLPIRTFVPVENITSMLGVEESVCLFQQTTRVIQSDLRVVSL